jgi:hypothetical protein
MVTEIELSESELAELRQATNQSDPVMAIRVAMREYLRHARRMQLKSLSGKVEMLDNWQSLERAKLDAASEE